eukprot:COSAG02_NODE_2082_length_9895_cov_23.566558_4_plen_84_part_00
MFLNLRLTGRIVVDVSSVATQMVLLNLFVVILVDNFGKCFIISKMDIQQVRFEDTQATPPACTSSPVLRGPCNLHPHTHVIAM